VYQGKRKKIDFIEMLHGRGYPEDAVDRFSMWSKRIVEALGQSSKTMSARWKI